MKKIGLLILAGLLLLSCEIDHGLDVMGTRITGNLLFVNPDERPEYVESVRMIAAVSLPFSSLGDIVMANRSVDLSNDEPEYYIPAPAASYMIVAAIWKERGKEWNPLNILGYYGFDPRTGVEDTTVVPVVLSKKEPVATDIDIVCDWNMAIR